MDVNCSIEMLGEPGGCYRIICRSVQEQVGINTVFPGTTEYTDRYRAPRRDDRDPDYIINPSPNFNIDGRVLATPAYCRNTTEYRTRYEWPDGNKITKYPWLRK